MMQVSASVSSNMNCLLSDSHLVNYCVSQEKVLRLMNNRAKAFCLIFEMFLCWIKGTLT